MRFKPALWRPLSMVLSGLNLIGAGFAAAAAEPVHATVHATLALAFGLWAQRLWRDRPAGGAQAADLDVLEADLGSLRGELSEAQERMDFIERVLARAPERPRADPPSEHE
jgi:hypothetical protein